MKRLTLLLGLLLLCAGVLGYLYQQGYYSDISTDFKTPPSLAANLRYHTESEWISSAIATNIADLLHFSQAKAKSPLQFQTRFPEGDKHLEIVWHKPGWFWSFFPSKITQPIPEYLWSPTLYVPLVESLAKGLTVPASESPSNGKILETLLNPQVEVVEKENQRLSEWLTRAPLSPTAHEEASLLCGVMALREAAGCFYDARPAMNQLTAHLSIAGFLRHGAAPSEAGTTANLILEVMAGRQRRADELLQKWQAAVIDDPIKSAWARALALRNTGNWTVIASPGSEPLLVRLEYLRATAFQVDNSLALNFYKQDGTLQKMPDIARIGLTFHPSVGEGHFFSRITFQLEVAEIKRLMEARNQTFLPGKLGEFVNVAPGTPVQPAEGKETKLNVITAGAWGRFYQRHILHETLAIYYFINKSWGVPENALKFKNSLTPLISSFLYYPIVQFRWAEAAETPNLLPSLRRFVVGNMETIADYNFIEIAKADSELNGIITPWYTPFEPVGTTYATEFRSFSGKFFDEVETYYQLRQLSLHIARGHFRNLRLKKPATLDLARECFGSLLDSNLWTIRIVADALKDNSAECEALYEKMVQLDPNAYILQGHYLVASNQPEKAAMAYQKAVDLATDHVSVANSCNWLVNYYFDHDRKAEALKVASFAAEVYSFRGLETMMNLQERLGNASEAEVYGRKILDRYADSSPLLGLYGRHPELPGRQEFQKQLDEETARLYPQGVQRVTLDSFKEPPVDGIKLGPSSRLQSLGIEANTVIVAVDGIRIHNEPQYIYARGLNPSSKMDLIIWKNGRYEALTVDQPGRRFGVDIINYHK